MKQCEIRQFPACSYALQEGFNTLSTNLTFTGQDVRKILITSSAAGEGKSFVAMNLMRTLAGLGHTAVLVDFDLRRSQLRARYGVAFPDEQVQGSAHYLAGLCRLDDVCYRTNIDGGFIVPAGRAVNNSLQLLSTERTEKLLDAMAKNFDYVLVDSPPLGAIIDAVQIARFCDGAIVVTKCGSTTKKALKEVCEQFTDAECLILGTVLNEVEAAALGGKYYYRRGYYTRSYTPSESKADRRAKRKRA